MLSRENLATGFQARGHHDVPPIIISCLLPAGRDLRDTISQSSNVSRVENPFPRVSAN